MIKAPYNFVPLSRIVFFPKWRNQISHDIPFEKGVSGEIDCNLSNITPIFIRNGGKWSQDDIRTKPEAQSFFKIKANGKDQYIIPGTSIKGMLRNILSIASFGKMEDVDKRPYSIRDLSPAASAIYGKNMTQGRKALPNAGWVRKDKKTGKWYLRHCEFARVEQSDLIAFHSSEPDIRIRQSAQQKYQKWGDQLGVDFKVDSNERHKHTCGLLIYKKVIGRSLLKGDKGTREQLFSQVNLCPILLR